jgi:hypothetical protein
VRGSDTAAEKRLAPFSAAFFILAPFGELFYFGGLQSDRIQRNGNAEDVPQPEVPL